MNERIARYLAEHPQVSAELLAMAASDDVASFCALVLRLREEMKKASETTDDISLTLAE